MVAPLAKEDYEDLIADGLSPTIEDFDRLNCLALRMQCGGETTAANAPRVGWAGDVPFYQPTVQAITWYYTYAERLTTDEQTQGTLWYFALAHAREEAFFAHLRTPGEIEPCVRAWAENLPVTKEEVERACHFAISGFDDAEAGKNPERNEVSHRADTGLAADALSRLREKMTRVCSLCGVPYDKLMIETPSALDALAEVYYIEQGREVRENDAKMMADYKFALHEIRTRLLDEKKGSEDGE